jgi:hypothetical protein
MIGGREEILFFPIGAQRAQFHLVAGPTTAPLRSHGSAASPDRRLVRAFTYWRTCDVAAGLRRACVVCEQRQ